MRFCRLIPCLLLGALVLSGCADATSGSDDPDRGPGALLPVGDVGVPQPDANMTPIPPGARELQLLTDRDPLVFFGQTIDVRVKYIASNVNIPNARITMRLFDAQGNDRTATGHEGSGLRTSNANTNAQGEATFQFIAGPRVTNVRLEASADSAAPISVNIVVGREGAGSLTVSVNYNTNGGRYSFRDLSSAEVTLFSNQNCEVLRGSALNLQGAEFAAELSPFNEIDNHVTVNDLNDGATFSAAAVVKNLNDHIVAFGCADAIEIIGGEVTSIDIQADDLPLEFKGKFTVVNKFDLVDLLRSSDNNTLNTVADVLDILRILGGSDGERGDAVIELFCELVNIDDGICRILQPLGSRLIESAIERFVPQQVLDVLTVISDVLTIVAEMTTVGEIEFTQPVADANGRLEANDNRWQKFRFTWNRGCPMGDNCTREFTIGDLDVNRRPIAGAFGATLEGDQLLLDAHNLNFRYGLIVLGILETWLFPAITGSNMPVSLADLLESLIPCEDVNDFFGDPQSGICEDVLIAALSELVIDQIGRLDFEPEQFEISGYATVVDEDGDLQVDRLDNGVWVGVIHLGDGNDLVFPGCFNACRDGECPPPSCLLMPVPEDLVPDEGDMMGEP